MKKTWILLVLSILCLALFTACTSNADIMPSPSPMVSVSPSTSPMATMSVEPTAATSPMPEAGVNTIEDAMRVSDSVSEEVEKLSELDMAQAIVAGNMAIVGFSYDTQYQGGLTDRLVDMVDARVQAIDKTVTAVHVSDDKAVMEKLKALHERMQKKDITFEQLQTEILDIGSMIAGGSNADAETPKATTGTGV